MTAGDLFDTPGVELYFYDELDAADRQRVGAHLRACAACRQRLDDLQAIRRALAAAPVVDAPPAGDWSGFMRRLDDAVTRGSGSAQPKAILERAGGAWSVRQVALIAATLAIVAIGVFMASRQRTDGRRRRTECCPSTRSSPPPACAA